MKIFRFERAPIDTENSQDYFSDFFCDSVGVDFTLSIAMSIASPPRLQSQLALQQPFNPDDQQAEAIREHDQVQTLLSPIDQLHRLSRRSRRILLYYDQLNWRHWAESHFDIPYRTAPPPNSGFRLSPADDDFAIQQYDFLADFGEEVDVAIQQDDLLADFGENDDVAIQYDDILVDPDGYGDPSYDRAT
jgi:hypothetical protein